MIETVENLMTTTVACAGPDYKVSELEQMLEDHNIRCLPIIDSKGRCIGVVTPIDILRWHRKQGFSAVACAKDIYSHPVIAVEPNLPVTSAIEIMILKKIHHLIVEREGELIGILSAMDFLEQLYSIFQSRKSSAKGRD